MNIQSPLQCLRPAEVERINATECHEQRGVDMKNVVILAMSTLRTRDAVVTGDYFAFPGWKELKENFRDSSEERGILYFSQLEPISRMIRAKEGSLDYVVILATREAMDPEPRRPEVTKPHIDENDPMKDSCYGLSAVDYYLKRIEAEKYGTKRDIVLLDQTNMVSAISETVSKIRNYWKTEKDTDKRLWMDTQGAQREVNLVLNAIISLLGSSGDGIVPRGRYSIAYDSTNTPKKIPQPIIDQTKTYQIFDFVSGINELTAYGKADQLSDYYEKRNEQAPEIVETMKGIAGSIQLCDMEKFDKELKKLREQWQLRDKKSSLLNIFAEQLQEDYKTLLDQSCTKLDIIEWLCKKGFYQQTLTYIESHMPADWKNREIWDCESCVSSETNWKKQITDLKKSRKKGYESVENFIIGSLLYDCFKRNNDKHDSLAAVQKITRSEIRRKGKTTESEKIIISAKPWSVQDEDKVKLHFIVNISDKYKFQDVLFLYMLLKDERNSFNHMGKDRKRASEEQLKIAIDLFVSLGRELQDSAVVKRDNPKSQHNNNKKKADNAALFPVDAFANIKL